MYEKLNFPPLNSILLILSSLEIQRRLLQFKTYYKLFYSVWKETSHKPLKVAAAKKYFPSVCTIDTTCCNECFLFHVRHYLLEDITFYTDLSLPTGLAQPPCYYVLWNNCFERSSHFISIISTITSQCC